MTRPVEVRVLGIGQLVKFGKQAANLQASA